MTSRTCLHAVQAAAGAKMIDFHGWEMPVQFAGIAAEHQAVRTACGVFDLCHMGRLHVDGAGSTTFLGSRICRPLADMRPGVVRYGLVLAEDGTVVDDVLVSREGEHAWHVVVNASNKDTVLALWGQRLPADVRCADISDRQAMIAVQGPRAADLLAGLSLDGRALKYYRFLDATWRGATVRLSRTGYTGEDGFELFVDAAQAPALWEAVRAAGATPCGLGARDTLRIEAGMPLYGQELSRSVTPVEAGLAFAIARDGGFVGAPRVLKELREGTARRLVGLRMREKRVPRTHYPVVHEGAPVGEITSGTLSPTLGAAIGMAYVPTALAAPGTALTVDVRGTPVPADVVPLPFYKRS